MDWTLSVTFAYFGLRQELYIEFTSAEHPSPLLRFLCFMYLCAEAPLTWDSVGHILWFLLPMKQQELSGSPKSTLYDGSNLGRKLSTFSRICNFGFHLAGSVTEKWGSSDLQRLLLSPRCLGCRVPSWEWASFHIRQHLWRSQLAWRPGENTRQLLWRLVFKVRVKAPGCSSPPGGSKFRGPLGPPGL